MALKLSKDEWERAEGIASLREQHAACIKSIAALEAALQKIIEMNVQYAIDRYGDAAQADGMGCVVVARTALSGKIT